MEENSPIYSGRNTCLEEGGGGNPPKGKGDPKERRRLVLSSNPKIEKNLGSTVANF